MDERERKYLEMIAQFPESPLGYFTLGKYYLELGRAAEAVAPLEKSLKEEPGWTAAMVALADALAAVGEKAGALALLQRARGTAQAAHGGMAGDIEERLEDLQD